MIIRRDVSLRKTIFRVAGPAMVEMIMYMVIGVVDIAVVGHLGAAPLAAVSLGAEIFFSLVLFLEALAVGATVLVAQAKGAKDSLAVRSIVSHTLIMGVVLGLTAGWLGWYFTDDILSLFSVEPQVYAQSRSYLLIAFQAAPFALVLYMTNALFRGLGRTDIPMTIAIIVNIVNVVGDFLLVYGLAGFPEMGVAGAAVATAGAHVIGFVLAIIALFTGLSGVQPRLADFARIRLQRFRSILAVGIPSLGEQFVYITSNLLALNLLVYLGTRSFATHQIAITVESISFMPGFGMAIAATALVGQAVGARDYQAARNAARGCIEMAFIIMGFFALLFVLMPGWVARIFTSDPAIIELAEAVIRIASLEQLTIAFSLVVSGVLKGAGDTRTPMLVSMLFTWAFRLPLMYLLIRIWSVPLPYIWYMFVLDWLLRTSVYVVLYRRGKWLPTQLPEPSYSD